MDFLTHQKRKNKGEVPLIIIENHHEPIISREIWYLAQERLRKNYKHGVEDNGHSNRYVFSGKIKCGECGSNFVGRVKKSSNGSSFRRWSCYTAANEGSTVYEDVHGNSHGCKVGKLLRDDDAMNMLKTAIKALQIDTKAIISNVTTLALDAIQAGENGVTANPERLCYEIERTERKKEDVMDSYFSGNITKEDMQAMKNRYEQQLVALRERLVKAEEWKNANRSTEQLKAAIQGEVTSILNCETESEVLYKNILNSIIVFKDRHLELRLNHLPQVFQFAG